MFGILSKNPARKPSNKMPYSFGYAPLFVGVFVIVLLMWWFLGEEPRPTIPTIPGAFWKALALSTGFVVGGIVGVIFVWRINHQDGDERDN